MTSEYITTGFYTKKKLLTCIKQTKGLLSQSTKESFVKYLIEAASVGLGIWALAQLQAAIANLLYVVMKELLTPERTMEDCIRAGLDDLEQADLDGYSMGATDFEFELAMLSTEGIDIIQGCRVIGFKVNGAWRKLV